jgi:peptide/nickel transport system permease protein
MALSTPASATIEAPPIAKPAILHFWSSPGVRRFRRNRTAVLGLGTVLLLLFCAIAAPLLTTQDPLNSELTSSLRPPGSAGHWLGTDELGRDVWSRILFGSRISLTLGLVSVGIGLLIGVPIPALAAYRGGWADSLVMRVVDILLSFPAILLAIVVVSILGPSLYNAMVAVGIAQGPIYARLVRGVVLSLKEREFVEAARATGLYNHQIVFRHILPNCLSPIIIQSTLLIASSILSASALSFLGLGAQPPDPEWGAMLSKGRLYLRTAPFLATFPGLAIVLPVRVLNLLGVGLRDALDPRMGER